MNEVKLGSRSPRRRFKCVVHFPNIWNLAGLHRQIVAHKAIEMDAVGFLTEVDSPLDARIARKSCRLQWLALSPIRMKFRMRSAWLNSRPVEFMLSKMSCGLS